MTFGFISVAACSVRIIHDDLKKLPCQSTTYHYMTLRSVCCVLWVRLVSLGPYSEPIISHRCYTHSDTIHVRLRQNLRIFFSRTVQSIVRVVYTVFGDRIINLWIVTSALTDLRHAWADMFVECDAIGQPKEATSSTFFVDSVNTQWWL